MCFLVMTSSTDSCLKEVIHGLWLKRHGRRFDDKSVIHQNNSLETVVENKRHPSVLVASKRVVG